MVRRRPLEVVAASPLGRAAAPVGRRLAAALGAGPAAELRRGRTGPYGPVALAAVGGGDLAARTLARLGVEPVAAPGYDERLGALVLDVTGVATLADAERVRALLRPAVRGLAASGRVVLVGREVDEVAGVAARAVHHGLDGLTRTLAKELRAGSTANLVRTVAGTTPAALASTLAFLLDGRSAYVDGQVWSVGVTDVDPDLAEVPYEGRVVAVTGAARGIGAAVARTLARDGATVVCVDVPAAGEALAAVTNEVRGTALQLDVTAADAGAVVAAHVAGRYGAPLHAVVHNAGITRDRLLANLDERQWAEVLEVNLAAVLRITEQLLDGRPGGLADGGRVVALSSTSGLAGNRGQAAYAWSKSGVVGFVEALAPRLAERRITVNAVAPGFIATPMTEAIPYLLRQLFQRMNSLQQPGLPVDVAETVAYLAAPASAAVSGQVVRVCGQAVVGR